MRDPLAVFGSAGFSLRYVLSGVAGPGPNASRTKSASANQLDDAGKPHLSPRDRLRQAAPCDPLTVINGTGFQPCTTLCMWLSPDPGSLTPRTRAAPSLLPRTSSTTRATASIAPRPAQACEIRWRLSSAVPTLTMRLPAAEYVASLAWFAESALVRLALRNRVS
jgi:hypothetical protein